MKLKKLIKNLAPIQIRGSKEIEITGVCANSKLVAPGNLFVARRGVANDGSHFIPEAIEAGAIALLTDMYNPFLKNITQLIHPQVANIEALLANRYYQDPSDELFTIGITGTNGKTTTTFLIKHLLDSLGLSCGLIGTIEYIMGQHRYAATRTTPDATSNQKMLREMVKEGCAAAVMEVTSHALHQGRVDSIHFDAAIFTNLTLDHLDYHSTLEEYAHTKHLLFSSLNPHKKKREQTFVKTAIFNRDDPWCDKMQEGCKVTQFTYGLVNSADLMASAIQLSPIGSACQLSYQGANYKAFFPLVGRFNIYNCMAAISIGLMRNLPLKDLIEIMAQAPSIPGRLQAVENPLGLKIYIDFAHSDDALLNVLTCLREFTKGRLITLFGCGGDRDVSKRPRMAQVSEDFSDFTFVTSDNPRSEEPQEIIRQIIKGFKQKDNYSIEVERYQAIEKAIQMATEEDIILIAGRGHESFQIFAHQTMEFDDAKVARCICENEAQKRLQ